MGGERAVERSRKRNGHGDNQNVREEEEVGREVEVSSGGG